MGFFTLTNQYYIAGGRKAVPSSFIASLYDGQQFLVAHIRKKNQTYEPEFVFSFKPSHQAEDTNLLIPSQAQWTELKGYIKNTLGVKRFNLLICLPRHQLFFKWIELPPIEKLYEMPGMVRFQLTPELPFPYEEAIIDFIIQPTSQDLPILNNKLKILACAIRKHVVEMFATNAKAAGFKVIGACPITWAIPQVIGIIEPNAEVVLSVVTRPTFTVISLTTAEGLIYSRSVLAKMPNISKETLSSIKSTNSQGLKIAKPTELNRWLENIIGEVIHALRVYENKVGSIPSLPIYIFGSTELENFVADAIESKLDIKPKILKATDIFPNIKILDAISHTGGSILCGFAKFGLLHPIYCIDFLHPKEPFELVTLKRQRFLYALALSSFILATPFIGGHLLVNQLKAEKKQLDIEINQLTKEQPSYKATLLQLATITNWIRSSLPWLDVLAYLHKFSSQIDAMYVTSMRLGPGNKIDLQVQVKDSLSLNHIVQTLSTAGFKVQPPAVTPGPDSYGYSIRTRLLIDIPPVFPLLSTTTNSSHKL